jgi:putative selenate reductase FAD-binding subunit
MITEYHRPQTLDEALLLLRRKTLKTLPLGGGTRLIRSKETDFAVVDLQNLSLDQIHWAGVNLEIGGTVKLQTLLNTADIPGALQRAIRNEGGANFRNQATIAGEIVACGGRSAFVTTLLAMDARLVWAPGGKEVGLGDFLALRATWESDGLISQVVLPLNGNVLLEIVARTPHDQPILCVAVCHWPSGHTRVALGGAGKTPILAMDGLDMTGAEQAARNAYLRANDEWASAEYRSQTASELVRQMIGLGTGG